MRIGVYNKFESISPHLQIMFEDNDNNFDEGLFSSGLFFRELWTQGKESKLNFVWIKSIDDLDNIDYLLFSNFPNTHDSIYKYSVRHLKERLLLFSTEPKIIISRGHIYSHLKKFKLVFTFNDDLVTRYSNIVKFNLPQPSKIRSDFVDICNRRDAVLISANKSAYRFKKGALHNKKVALIRALDKSSLDLDVFGPEWHKAKRFPILKKLFFFRYRYYNFSGYKGYVEDKLNKTSEYRFSLVVENSRMNGYISEKIFEAMFAYSVPIYLGAPNVENYIPANSFINVAKFVNMNELLMYLESLTNDTIESIIKNGQDFLSSEKFIQFTSKFQAENLVNSILTLNRE